MVLHYKLLGSTIGPMYPKNMIFCLSADNAGVLVEMAFEWWRKALPADLTTVTCETVTTHRRPVSDKDCSRTLSTNNFARNGDLCDTTYVYTSSNMLQGNKRCAQFSRTYTATAREQAFTGYCCPRQLLTGRRVSFPGWRAKNP